MALVLVLIAVVLIVAALRNTQAQLASALLTDVPAFFVWAAAILAVGALGFIPGFRGPARALMALVITVLVLKNYQTILTGFQSVSAGSGAPVASPAAPDQSIAQTAAAAGVDWTSAIPGPVGWIPAIVNRVAGAITGAATTQQPASK